MLSLTGGLFLGWSLGANNAANVMGAAVTSRMLRFATAAWLAATFVVLGAMAEGQAGMETISSLSNINLEKAVIASVAAALTTTIMTLLGMPISTSQAVIGGILGIGIINNQLDFSGLGKIFICWVGTPIGGLILGVITYKILAALYNWVNFNFVVSDIVLRVALIVVGCYGAYSLGANNVANVTGVFVGAGAISIPTACLVGGLSIGLGIVTFSRGVMETVGKKLVKLDPFSALVVVLAEAVTVHFYTMVGVPVSTSHALVGAVIGVGLLRGSKTIGKSTLISIVSAWVLTPLVGCFLAICIYFCCHLQYVN